MFRNLDTTHDWTFGTGKNNYVVENQEIGLNIETRLLSFYADCFFDINAGIDWWSLLDYRYEERLENAISEVIKNTPGVTSVNNIDIITDSNRQYRIKYDIQTIYTQSYTGEIIPISN